MCTKSFFQSFEPFRLQYHHQATALLEQTLDRANDPPTMLPPNQCSGCGNYGLVGTRGGHVFRYNMQSGQPRGSYPQCATPSPKAVKALANVVKPGSIAKITADGFSSKRIGGCLALRLLLDIHDRVRVS